jgi:membrane protease YdiL (CAAX protease family)
MLTLVALALIILGAGLAMTVVTFIVLEPEASAEPAAASPAGPPASAGIQGALVSGGIGAAILIAAGGFVPGIRRLLARVLPFDPESFVHTVALVAVTALTLISFVPLLVLSDPPLSSLVRIMLARGEDLTAGRGRGGMLLDELYGLVWLVPAAIVIVGYGVRRSFKEAIERLGVRRPTWRQVAAGVGLAGVLVIAVRVVSPCVDWVWDRMGWSKTDMEAFEQLLPAYFSALGALVIGVVAGIGEELAVRGVLQPRLGIWLSNLFFTGLHASQYNWDGLLIILGLGLVFGLIRKKTNTTTSAILHGTYDFLLIMAGVLQIPWLSD